MSLSLPPTIRSRLRPGSRSSQIVAVVHQQAARFGYGPTVDEARQAFARAGHQCWDDEMAGRETPKVMRQGS